jgi:hypothetical protein
MAFASNDDPESLERLRSFMGPGHVDQMVHQAMQCAWMMLPDDRKTVAEVERVIRQIVDRALKNFRDDAEAFGKDN